MSELDWNWLSAPYIACAVMMAAVALLAALVRGDRVMRLGVAGAALCTVPWATCSALAACTHDPATATRLLRLGLGPVALVGPSILLVLLGVSGQLERLRWLARVAGVLGVISLAVCWGTTWTVPGVRPLPAGLLYVTAGPLTAVHVLQLAAWFAIGMLIVRRTWTTDKNRQLGRVLIGLFVAGAMASLDLLVVHGAFDGYPIAWVPVLLAGALAMYVVLSTDLLRPQGLDHGVLVEVLTLAVAIAGIGAFALVIDDAAPLALAAVGGGLCTVSLGVSWAIAARRPVRVAGERALEQFVGRLADVEDERVVADRLAALWAQFEVEVRALSYADGDHLVEIISREPWVLDREVVAWLVEHAQPIAPGDLATMRLGPLRPRLEALVMARGTAVIVPLIDRDGLVGLVEAEVRHALREGERGLLAQSARAAARALTYAALARAAAREGETAREVEVAEAMRLQAAASRNDELGGFAVAAEYRSAPRTTGAAWTATLLADGRLAVLVTDAHTHGVAAALATAALTGAFAAATAGLAAIELDELLASLRASAAGVLRGDAPLAAFIAVLDAERQRIAWARAGHVGACLIGPGARDLGGDDGAATLHAPARGEAALPPEAALVVASATVCGADPARWEAVVREQAPAGARLATVLVDIALRRGDVSEDLLAVVVHHRPARERAGAR